MIARINKDVVTVIAAVVAGAFMIWGAVFLVGDIVRMDQDHRERIATEQQMQEDAVSEDMHEPMVRTDESVYDDNTGTYGPVMRPNGTIGMGTDVGGGVIIKPNGGIGFGFDLGL